MKSPIKRMSPKPFREKQMSMVITPKKILPDITNIIFKKTSPDPVSEYKLCNKTYNVKHKENFENKEIKSFDNPIVEENNYHKPVEDEDIFYDSLELSPSNLKVLNNDNVPTVTRTPDHYREVKDTTYPLEVSNTNLNLPYSTPRRYSPLTKNKSRVKTKDLLNISSLTYVKDDVVNSESFIIANTSSETYVKDNINCGTFVIDNEDISMEKLLSPAEATRKILNTLASTSSPFSFQPVCSNNMGQGSLGSIPLYEENRAALEKIAEESTLVGSENLISQYRKRKSNVMFAVTPPKKSAYLENVINSSRKIRSQLEQPMERPETDPNVKYHTPGIFISSLIQFHELGTHAYFLEPKWMEEQEINFKNWLNSILTSTSLDSKEFHIDVSKLWQKCLLTQQVQEPEHLEPTALRYNKFYTNMLSFYKSPNIAAIIRTINEMVDDEKLSIRTDKNIHLDLSLQSEFMCLLLNYNRVWLRIGFEVIYSTNITNCSLMAINSFISERFFRDPALTKKLKSIHLPKYCIEIKKLILKRFLCLVYLLDQAKENKIIPKDSCLFNKCGLIKESREIVLQFSQQLLSAVGDLTKYLKRSGYVINHKQTYIHEFNYTVFNLGTDLRDGVRLMRLVEIIDGQDGLIEKLRVPAISRLQKIYNMGLVFDALKQIHINIIEDITPKDLVEGHREKTLLFLWKIIYKFELPRLNKAASVIQNWWGSLPIIIKRYILMKRHHQEQKKLSDAAVKIQSYWKMYKQRCFYKIFYNQIIKLQSFVRMFVIRNRYLKLKLTVINIENIYLANREMLYQRERYTKMRNAAILIQLWYRNNMQMRKHFYIYKQLKSTTLWIQRRYRANLAMRAERQCYLEKKKAVIIIQSWFVSLRMMKNERKNYMRYREAVISVQIRYRAKRAGLIQRIKFSTMRKAAITIQSFFRMYKHRKLYIKLKYAVLYIENMYIAKTSMIRSVQYFQRIKSATLRIQSWYRGIRAGRIERQNFKEMKDATTKIQNWYRGTLAARIERLKFQRLKETTLFIQRKYRANRLCKVTRLQYQQLKKTVIFIQKIFRANKLARTERATYVLKRGAAIKIQRWYKSLNQMRRDRDTYLHIKDIIYKIQIRIKCKLRTNSIKERNEKIRLHRAAVKIQVILIQIFDRLYN